MANKTCILGVALSSVLITAYAEERVYPVMDAQGRVQLLKSQVEPAAKDTQKESVTHQELATPADNKSVPQTPAASPVPTQANEAFRQLENETYVDSDYLEKKNFNLQDKKRFYYVPNGTGSQQVIESNGDNIAAVPTSKVFASKRRTAFYADDYQVLSKEWLLQYAPSTQQLCQQAKKLKKASKPFKDSNALWLTADSHSPRFDRVLAFSEVIAKEQHLRISSFASTNKSPKFYVPMVTFLDAQGCVLSGAWQYWSQAFPANEHHFSSVEGLLRVPSATQYLAFLAPVAELNNALPQQMTGSLLIENE
ncbi:MAG: putative pilus assembly protein FilE [Moraxellaceae bacterium]|nr:putative pilus assembly protein FilE [Moraxellaceae bacterium]